MLEPKKLTLKVLAALTALPTKGGERRLVPMEAERRRARRSAVQSVAHFRRKGSSMLASPVPMDLPILQHPIGDESALQLLLANDRPGPRRCRTTLRLRKATEPARWRGASTSQSDMPLRSVLESGTAAAEAIGIASLPMASAGDGGAERVR